MHKRSTSFEGINEAEIRLFAVEHAAKLMSVGKNTVFNLIAQGRLKAVKVGSRTLIPRACLDAFLSEIGAP